MKKKLLFITFLMLFCLTMFGQFTPKYSYTSDGTYDNPMTLSAVIEFDGEEQNNPNLELGVFCGDELRGGAFVLERNGRYYARPLIYGQSGQFFTFKVYDHTTGIEIEREWSVGSTFTYGGSTMEYMSYNSNGYGNFSQPAVIDFVTPNYWNPEPFQFNFQVTAVILKDGVEQTDTNLELGAFSVSDGTVRGSVKLYPQTILGNTRYYAYMLVGGTSGEEITFKLYDHGTRQELQFNDVNTCILTEDDDATGNPILGSYIKPFEVNFITAPYVAQIDDAKYTSFEAALTAAEDGDEIILLENITLEENPTVVSKDININLNSKTVSGTIKLAHTGATVTGVAEAMTVTSGVEGYIVVLENGVYSLSERQPSGQVAYRAYINDNQSREAVQVDLTNVYAKTSFVVELLDASGNVLTTTSLKAGGVDAANYTCNIVLWGTASGSWDTEIKASKLTVANIPATIKVYADGTLVDTYANALGAGTNVDETEKYKALDCVYKEAKIGETLYATFAAALTAAVDDNEIILLENITLEENPTVVSKDININLNSKTVSGTIKLAHTGATVTGVAEAMTVTSGVEGYIVVLENGVYSLSERQPSGQVAYRAYINDNQSREAVQVDLTNVYAKTSFVVELLDANGNVLTTTSLKAGGVDAANYTCNIVLWGTASGSWDTEIKASKLTVANIPATIKVYADGTLVDTYANALGAGTNVDETEDYKALDCVYKEAKIGETLYESLQAAVNAVTETDNTVKVLTDIALSEGVTVAEGKTVVLDLNGKTINAGWADETAGKHIYAFTNNGTLTIKGEGTINARGNYNYGTMTLENGTINAIDGNGGYGVRNYLGATFTMNGGTIATQYEDGDVPGEGYDASPVRVDDGATFTMNDGVINNVSNFTVAIDNYGTTTINGGKATTIHTTLANHGTMIIKGGEFTCNGLEGITAHALWAAAGTTTINGGTFDGKDNYNGFNVDASAGATVNIIGGNFLPVHSGSLYGEGTIAVSGGTFFDQVPEARCAAGYIPQDNADGTYGVKPGQYVAQVGDVKYESLQEAVNVGGEVTILQDFVLTETVTIAAGKEVVLDLNGKTINVANDQINCDIYGKLTVNDTEGTGVFTSRNHFVQAGAELIVNAGTIQNIATATGGFPINLNGGTVTVNGGTVQAVNNGNYAIGGNGGGTLVINDGTIKGNWGAVNMSIGTATINGGTLEVTGAIGGHALYVAGANVTINGGEFIPYPTTIYSYAVLTNDDNANVSITGGTFKKGLGDPCVKALSGNITITGGTFSTDVNDYCHENYDAIQGADNLWRVEQVLFAQTTALANGWNWYSSYINDDVNALETLQTALGTNGIQIKDNNYYTNYYENIGWYGRLTTIAPNETMYMIKTSADTNVEIEGAKVDPSTITITIQPGWNYIPYPLDVAQSITTALGFDPQKDDIIKGKGSVAVYMVGSNGYGWFEEFNMEPGKGYMYKSNAATTITFNYSYPTGGAKSSMLANVETIDYHWTVDAHKYANSMNMIAMVNVDGEMIKGGYEVAAFSNEGECRGTARPFYVEDMDAYLMILTIHGEEVENLTFRYYDIDTDTEYELNNVVTYSDNAIVGTIDNPYIFTMNILGIGENSIDNINIYPNPTTTDREINLNATFDKVEVYNALGVKVVEYQNIDTIDALETAGIYVIRVTDNNGDVKHCRLVVK